MAGVPMDQREGWIWFDGEMVPWKDAKIHVLTHTLAALLKTKNDRWQVTPERVAKLIDGPRIAQDVGVAGAMK